MRRTVVVALGTLVAACGSKSGGPLHPAGSAFDDGAGQLARVSGALYFEGADESVIEARPTPSEPVAGAEGGWLYGGATYGYGGATYGVTGAQINAAPRRPYAAIAVQTGGSVIGQVTWPRPPRALPTVPSTCGDLPNELVLGTGGGAPATIVYLDGIAAGKPPAVAARTLRLGGELERRGCALVPAVQVVVPAPTSLEISNGDRSPVALEIRGANGQVALELEPMSARRIAAGPGLMTVREAGGAAAWVMVSEHPYVTLTDGDGRFRIDEVPPGTYDLVAMHAPVITAMKDGHAVIGEPVVVRRTIKIAADAPTSVTVALP